MFIKINFKSATLNIVEPPRVKGGGLKLDENGKVMFGDITQAFDLTGNQYIGYSPRKNEEILSTVDGGNRFGTVFNPIHMEQVSNMLHVLMGERPVSTFHTPVINGKPIRKRDEFIDNIARNGYYRINTSYTYEFNNEKRAYLEFKQGKKISPSNPKGSLGISFNALKNHFIANQTKERYDEFIKILSKYTKKAVNEKNYSFVSDAYYDLFENDGNKNMDYVKAFERYKSVQGTKINMLINDLKASKFDLKYINGTFRNPSPNNVMSMKSTNTHVMGTVSLDGSFVFDVDYKTAERILNGKRVASFLDNGVVSLAKWTEDFGVDSYVMDCVYEIDLEEKGYSKIG